MVGLFGNPLSLESLPSIKSVWHHFHQPTDSDIILSPKNIQYTTYPNTNATQFFVIS